MVKSLSLHTFLYQIVVPVNMRFNKAPPKLENRFAAPLVPLPVNQSDPEKSVRVCAGRAAVCVSCVLAESYSLFCSWRNA